MRKGFLGLLAALAATIATAGSAFAAKPALEPMYANDTTVYMAAPAKAVAGGDVHNAQDFYLIAYLNLPANGMQPKCNFSCPTPPGIPPVRDVVLEGAPGFGANGTSGAYSPHWHVLVLVYDPSWLADPNFAPAESAAEVDQGEAAGHFLPIASGSNPYELDTGIYFLCVIVSANA